MERKSPAQGCPTIASRKIPSLVRWTILILLPVVAQAHPPEILPGTLPKAVEELLHMRSPPPDWRAHIRSRIELGQPLPQWEPRSIEPADDAPLGELIKFWSDPPYEKLGEVDDNFHPSAVVARRLVRALADKPELAHQLSDHLLFDADVANSTVWTSRPESYPTSNIEIDAEVMRSYEALIKGAPGDTAAIGKFRNWLMMHTEYLRDELIEEASTASPVSDDPFGSPRTDSRHLDRLIEVDWPAAEGILKKFVKSATPHWQIYALGQLIGHGAGKPQIEKWRAELKAIALDGELELAPRRHAIEALLAGKNGRERRRLIAQFAALDEELVSWLGESRPSRREAEAAQAAIAVDDFLSRLRDRELHIDWVWRALRDYKKFAPRALEVEGLAGGQLALQISIGRDLRRATEMLVKGEPAEQAMLLVCACHVRLPLQLDLVSALLDSDDALVAHAAQHFLESDDSENARRKLLSQNPDQALITGAWGGFDPGSSTFHEYRQRENESRSRVLNGDADEVIALLSSGHWGDEGNRVIEIKDGKAKLYHREYTVVTGEELIRYRERELDPVELTDLRRFTETYAINDLPAYSAGSHDGIQYEFFQVTKAGGRRVFMNNPPRRSEYFDRSEKGAPPADIYGILVEKFVDIERAKPMTVCYRGIDETPGFKVLLQREETEIFAISGEAGALKVLRRTSGKYDGEAAWHWWRDGELSTQAADPPTDVPLLKPDFKTLVARGDGTWQARAGEISVRAHVSKEDDHALESGLWLHCSGKAPSLLARGEFDHPVISSNAKWVAVASGKKLHRIRIETGEASEVELTADGKLDVVAYIEPHRQFLIKLQHAGDYRFLDPETGKLGMPMGDFRPLDSLRWRPLQATGNPNEVWATSLGDRHWEPGGTSIGRYDLATFRFKVVQIIPHLFFGANEMWIDEAANSIYVVSHGDLLKFPLSE